MPPETSATAADGAPLVFRALASSAAPRFTFRDCGLGSSALGELFQRVMQALPRVLYDERFEDGELKLRDRKALILDPVEHRDLDGLREATELKLARVDYFQLLVLHEHVHPGLRARIEEQLDKEGTSWEDFRRDLANGLRFEGMLRTCPIGLSGAILFQDEVETHVLIAQRRGNLAVNPGAWTLPVDGGMRSIDDWENDFEREMRAELSWSEELKVDPGVAKGWHLAGMVVPVRHETVPGCASTGVNLVWEHRTDSMEQLHEFRRVAASSRNNEEARDYRVVAASRWANELAGLRPAEVLCGLLDSRGSAGASAWDSWQRMHSSSDARAAAGAPKRRLLSDAEVRAVVRRSESTTEGATKYGSDYFESLIRRYPGLGRSDDNLVDESISLASDLAAREPDDLDDLDTALSEQTTKICGLVVPLLAELEVIRRDPDTGRFETHDYGRLYEAVIYRVAHELFRSRPAWPAYLARKVAAGDLGTLTAVSEAAKEIRRDLRGADSVHPGGEQPQPGEATKVVRDVTGADRLSNALADYLHFDVEKTQHLARLRLDAELLFHAVAITAKRDRGDADVGEYSLSNHHRRSLSGNQLALSFKASGLVATRTSSITQLRLGYEFCRAALKRFPLQPGVHHTAALYELRLATVLPKTDRGAEWLDRARDSIEQAVTLDPEWPEFYATRGLVRWRARSLELARLDYETALELVAREEQAPREWLTAWANALDRLSVADNS